MGTVRRARCTLALVATMLVAPICTATSVPAAGSAEAGAWGATGQGFQLRAEAQQLVVSPAIPVVIECTLRNVGRAGVRIAESYPELDYRLEVRNARGHLIPPTGSATTAYRTVSRELQPGEEITDQYRLNRMYLLAEADEYSITATRCVYRRDAAGVAEVASSPIVLRVAADSAAVSAWPTGGWGPVTEGVQLRIEVIPGVIPPRPALLLKLTMQNVTSRVLQVTEGTELHDYRLSVSDAEGRQIAVTRDCIGIEEAEQIVREILPGEGFTYEYDLNKKYDFLEAGEYTIVAKHRVPTLDGEGWAWVESNPVVLAVSEDGRGCDA